jgi:hypothetical protein
MTRTEARIRLSFSQRIQRASADVHAIALTTRARLGRPVDHRRRYRVEERQATSRVRADSRRRTGGSRHRRRRSAVDPVKPHGIQCTRRDLRRPASVVLEQRSTSHRAPPTLGTRRTPTAFRSGA